MKMRKNKIFFFILSIAFIACSPKVKNHLSQEKFQPFKSNEQVYIIDKTETVPEGSAFVSDLQIGDTGFSTICDYEVVMGIARKKALAAGANLIHILEAKEPNFWSACYRIKAKLYRNTDEQAMAQIVDKYQQKNKSRLPEDADYAVVYFYRPNAFVGSAIGYKIRREDDTKIGRVRNGEKFEYKTTDFGLQTFRGITETSDSVVIDVKKGQEYFVKCGIKTGLFIGRPTMRITENWKGMKEFGAMQ